MTRATREYRVRAAAHNTPTLTLNAFTLVVVAVHCSSVCVIVAHDPFSLLANIEGVYTARVVYYIDQKTKQKKKSIRNEKPEQKEMRGSLL